MAETRGSWRNIASVSFRQLPRKSVGICDMRSRQTEDGRWGAMRTTEENWPKWQRRGRNWRNIAPVSLRQPPPASAYICDMCGRQPGLGGGDSEETDEICLDRRHHGGVGEILLPPDPPIFRGLPWASGTCADRRREMENWK